MKWPALVAIAVALAMDAFAVAVVTGATVQGLTKRHYFRLSFHFGIFQAGLFAAGWLSGFAIHNVVRAFDHWLAFTILFIVGVNVIRQSFGSNTDARRSMSDPTSGFQLVTLSVATSIDAFAVGLSLAMVNSSLTLAAMTVGITAAAFTIAGMILGKQIGSLWGRWVEVLGGLTLVAVGAKILLDHLQAF